MPRSYRYIGPEEISIRSRSAPRGVPIKFPDDIRRWVSGTGQESNAGGLIIATFIVDLEGWLWIADRHSEHVACAGGEPVLSAGELGIRFDRDEIEVVEASNQSTGYCPEPESWPQVALALDRIPLRHPQKFTSEVVFRRCPTCGQVNIIKDGWLFCLACGDELRQRWNLGEGAGS
jgi:hypothetical protein